MFDEVVHTRIWCGGILNNHFIANFLGNLTAEKFENWLSYDEVTAMSLVSAFFMGHGVHVKLSRANCSKHSSFPRLTECPF